MSGKCTIILAAKPDEVSLACARDVMAALAERFPETLDLHRKAVSDPDASVLAGDADVAIHQAESLPLSMSSDALVGAYLARLWCTDAMVSDFLLKELPPAARVGTDDPRRQAMVLRARPDAKVDRGSRDVRELLQAWRVGNADAVIVSTASLRRLEIPEPREELDPKVFVPSPGQGAVACVCKQGSRFEEFLVGIDNPQARLEVEVERSVLRGIGGAPGLPVGVHVAKRGDSLAVHALVLSLDGRRAVKLKETIPAKDAMYHADDLGERLRGMGADVLLAQARQKAQ